MSFTVKEVESAIFHLAFSDHRVMTDTFMRFQEHYESPKFHGQIFSRAEFIKWYKTTTPSRKFTYYTDWGGFNIPSYILQPFYDGAFKRISKREQALLDHFEKKTGQFYIIASIKGNNATFQHEVAHGRFYVNEKYRAAILKILAGADTQAIRKWLLSIGYDELTIDDEVHAYLLTGLESLPHSIDLALYAPLVAELKKVENKYYGKASKS